MLQRRASVICARIKSKRLYLPGRASLSEGGDVKTNAGQSLGFRVLRDITAGTREATTRSTRADYGRGFMPRKQMPWWKRIVPALRRWIATVNNRLAGLYRLEGQSALEASAAGERVVALKAGEVVNLTKRFRAVQVEVKEGTIWLTGSSHEGDIVLQSGDQFDLLGKGVFVAQALHDAAVAVRRQS